MQTKTNLVKINSQEIDFFKVTKEIPIDILSKLNVHKALIWCQELHVSVLCTFNIGRISTGIYPNTFNQDDFEHLLCK